MALSQLSQAPMKGQKTGNGKSIEELYQKKTQLEHILLRPDSYVGSVNKVSQVMWVLDSGSSRIVQRPVTFVPGLYKIFDEILVNAADNKQRNSSMNSLQVTIDVVANTISVFNNGLGIPVAHHPVHGVWVPELIFGHLLTSSNYDDSEKKVTGGRNGYGAKLANIFSTRFTVEAADGERGLRLTQSWRGNMEGTIGEAVVVPYSGSDFVRVTFSPDLSRFSMASLDTDIVALMSRRVYDMAGVLGKGVSVKLNGLEVPARSFGEYVALYALPEGGGGRTVERAGPRWEVCATVSDGSFGHVSFVNGIATSNGGQHVLYIADQLAAAVAEVANKKNKGTDIKPATVRNHLFLFVNCLVDNPAFDSQTKETLTTRPKDFGSLPELSEKFVKAVLASGIVDKVLAWAQFKSVQDLQRVAGGKAKPSGRLLDLPKLDDANWAGTAKGGEATLILTEGDSAKTLAIAGLSVVGRDRYGVFPLKGKLLNVREASHKSIMGNAEIQAIVKIMGLQYGKQYESTKGLRYGHLMIMSDQDHDGSHIKGLLLNFLHHFWPSLLRVPGFLQEFITPIVKASKGKIFRTFFTLPEYFTWKDAEGGGGKGWAIKYYKGLGTSTALEAKEYFGELGTHVLDFSMDEPMVTGYNANDLIDLAFSKKRADDRKEWLKKFEPGTYVDYGVETMLVSEFIHKELILFSMADNIRSIPSLADGLKPAQRKVLFACFKRNLKTDIKVAQLAGYVSEHAAYHHGEASLAATIVGMAQNFPGSNNINLLVPSGQFGTRLMGGKDSASARYIFTRLSSVARALFHPDDDALLTYLDDDGTSIEPASYLPIIPLVLVNGVEGIGTGWSTSIPNHAPKDVIEALRCRIAGKSTPPLRPWYRGHQGAMEAKEGGGGGAFVSMGKATVDASRTTITITELPVGKWTQDYKHMLVEMVTGQKAEEKAKDAGKGKVGGPKGGPAAGGKGGKDKKKIATSAASGKGKKLGGGAKSKPGSNKENSVGILGGESSEVAAPRARKTVVKKAVSGGMEDEDEDAGDEEESEFEEDESEEEEEEEEGSEEEDDDSGSDAPKRKAKVGGGGKNKALDDRAALAALLPPPGESLIKDFEEGHTDTSVYFTIHVNPATASKLMATCTTPDGSGGYLASAFLRKVLKLDSPIGTTNMHLFDTNNTIRRYVNTGEIIEEFYGMRLKAYDERKAHLMVKLGEEADRCNNKLRFINAVITGQLKVSARPKSELLAELHDAGYKGFDPSPGTEEDVGGEVGEGPGLSIGASGDSLPIAVLAKRYSYLLSMPLWSLTHERVASLRSEAAEKTSALERLRGKTPQSLWLADLDVLESALQAVEAETAAEELEGSRKASSRAKTSKCGGGGAKKAAKKTFKKASMSDEEEESEDDSGDEEWGASKSKSKGKSVVGGEKKAASLALSSSSTAATKAASSSVGGKKAAAPTTNGAGGGSFGASLTQPSIKSFAVAALPFQAPPTALLPPVEDFAMLTLEQRLAARLKLSGGGVPSMISVAPPPVLTTTTAKRAVSDERALAPPTFVDLSGPGGMGSPLKVDPKPKKVKTVIPAIQAPPAPETTTGSNSIVTSGRPGRAAAAQKKYTEKDSGDEIDVNEEDDEDIVVPKKASSKKKTVSAAPAKAAATFKQLPKTAPAARPARANAAPKKKYVDSDDEEEEDEEEEEEEEEDFDSDY